MKSLLILGRQPALGIAELESLYGSAAVYGAGLHAAIVDVDPCVLAFDRLGGSMKFCKLLTTLETTDWRTIEKFLVEVSPKHLENMPEGKMQLGLSVYDVHVSTAHLMATGLTLKKVIKSTGRSVRIIPNKELELNTAQVEHNNLTGPNGWELVFVRDGNRTHIAQTIKVQDIESYTIRDRERPKRDARVGMLPPKLAQIIINLAAGPLPESALASICEIPAGETRPLPKFEQTILDPFCGTGVVLLEAALMGYEIYGTDLESRMTEYSKANLDWLGNQFKLTPETYQLEVGDATSYTWNPHVDIVAGETYLGRPFTSLPEPAVLAETISGCNVIIKKFLRNIYNQLSPGTRLCLAVPAWQVRANQFKHLPLIDSLSDMGYNRISFEHVRSEELLYFRPDQVVARELLVLQKS